MRVADPFAWISDAARLRAFAAASIAALVLMAALGVSGAALQNDLAPQGIVSFELAGSLARAQSIVDSWDEPTRVRAGLNLGLDYLFLVTYAAAIGLGCVLVAALLAIRAPLLAKVGALLAWGQLLAGLLDAVENFALWRVLMGSTTEAWPALARACALPKFALVAAGLLYVLAGFAVSRYRVGRSR